MLEENNQEFNQHHKHCWCKYAGLVLATLIGAFLAFYFIADMTVKHMMDPMYQIKKMDKLMQKEDRIAAKMGREMMKESGIPLHKSLVMVQKDADAYKIIVDLKPFDNNADDIDVSVEGKTVTVSGEIEKEKRNEERIMKFSQTFSLDESVDVSKMTKIKERGKCIITLPIKK